MGAVAVTRVTRAPTGLLAPEDRVAVAIELARAIVAPHEMSDLVARETEAQIARALLTVLDGATDRATAEARHERIVARCKRHRAGCPECVEGKRCRTLEDLGRDRAGLEGKRNAARRDFGRLVRTESV